MSLPTASRLTIRLFGPFQACRQDVPLAGLQMRDSAQLLALLILHHGSAMPCTALAKILWPQTGSLDSLRQSIAQLRRVLGEEDYRLESPKGMLQLNLEGVAVDFLTFHAAAGRPEKEALQSAIEAYSGPLLSDWKEKWVVKEREKYKIQYLDALRTLATLATEANDPQTAVTCLRRYVNMNPTEEKGWRDLMNARLAEGERVLAMEVYHTYRDYLRAKYKISPPSDMTLLYQQIQHPHAVGPRLPGEDWMSLDPEGGAVPLLSPFYIERSTDTLFQQAIARCDSIVLVKGPRQSGKTSLLARGLQQARDLGSRVVLTDFQKLSASHWTSSETLYLALAQSIADQLHLNVSPRDVWSDQRGANENFERYLRREALDPEATPLVWALDEVDRLFAYPFCSEIFALFRAWHNERSLDPGGPWERLTLAMAYATEAHLFITDLNQSPFNVGTRLTLDDFTLSEVAELNRRYGSPLEETSERVLLVFRQHSGRCSSARCLAPH